MIEYFWGLTVRETDTENQNCVGLVYYYLGIVKKDKYIEPPTEKQLLKHFIRVTDISKANVVAVIMFIPGSEPKVAHIGLIFDDKKTLWHRPGPGETDLEEGFETGINKFLKKDHGMRKIYYLRPKKNIQKGP